MRYYPIEYDCKLEEEGLYEIRYSKKLLLVIAYTGKRSKPNFHERYGSIDKMMDRINLYAKRQKEIKQEKIDKRNAKKNMKHTLKVGDVLSTSWGYDQTNVDMYQIVEMKTAKTAVLREIAQERVEGSDGMMSCQMIPVKDDFIGEPFTKRILVNGWCKEGYVSIKSFITATLLKKGESCYCSWYG